MYLARYGAANEAPAINARYRHVLVIPVFDEAEHFLNTVIPDDAEDLLIIVVINAPDHLPDDHPSVENTRQMNARLNGLHRYDAASRIDVLGLDRVSPGCRIPQRQGVGLARKLGADVATRYIQDGTIESDIIFTTDADARLPTDYFAAPIGEAAAWIYPFTHVARDQKLLERATLYELHMRYYVDRLAHAGSPYAHHALGSTLAIAVDAYAQVRGFPRRNAAEDFYVLNKLAKVGRITPLSAPTIELEARYSDRVPFGTGPALTKASASNKFESYAPATFDALKIFLAAASNCTRPTAGRAAELADELGFAAFLDRSPVPTARQIHTWFDGFRTLKFVHNARRFWSDTPLLGTMTALLPNVAPSAVSFNQALRESEARRSQPSIGGLQP